MAAARRPGAFAPQVLLGAVAGVFADRWDRRRTMIAADLLLAAGLLPLLLVHDASRVWIVFAVLFWEGCVEQFFSPAQQAMVPRLVPEGELVTANAVSGQVSNVSRLAGYVAAWLGALSALEGVSVLAGTLGAGYLSRLAGIVPVLAVQGAGYAAAGLVMLRCLPDDEEGVSLAPENPVAACPGTA